MKKSIIRMLAALLPAIAAGTAPAGAIEVDGISYGYMGDDKLRVTDSESQPYEGHITIPAHVDIGEKPTPSPP